MSFFNRFLRRREQTHYRDSNANQPDAYIGAVVNGANVTQGTLGPAWVYVTLAKGDQRGSPTQVLNRVVSPIFGAPVKLGKNSQGVDCIIDIAEDQIDSFMSGSAGGALYGLKVPPHSHEYGLGLYDLVDDRRLHQGLVWWRGTDGPYVVYINEYWYFDGSGVQQYYPGGTLDLSTLLTVGSGQHQWIKVGFDPVAGLPVAVAAAAVSIVLPLLASDLAAISFTGYIPLRGVQVSYGQPIQGEGDFTDCSQVRNGAGGTSGTVTSVALTVPPEFSVSGSPVTGSGTLAVSKATESAGTAWAGPVPGPVPASAATPAFRAITTYDLPDRYWAVYNYKLNGVGQKIGFAKSSDGRNFRRVTQPIIDAGTGWESDQVFHPNLIDVNGVYYLYYVGYDTSVTKIGLARSFDGGATWTKYASNPVLVANSSGWESTGGQDLYTPIVMYDSADADSTQRFKMWYAGGNQGGGGIGYAYSSDGLSWTKYSSNPVVSLGTAGQWDDTYLSVGGVVRLGSTYYLFYTGDHPVSGVDHNKSGYATFTNPKSSYTKAAGNPILVGDNISSALTVAVAVNDITLTVTDSTVFPVGAPVFVYDGSHNYLTQVIGRPSSTTLTTKDPAPVTVSTTSAFVKSVAYNSVDIVSPRFDGGWLFNFVGYQPTGPSGQWEFTMAAYAPADLSRVTIDYEAGLMIPALTSESTGGNLSYENGWILDLQRWDDRLLNPSGGSDADYYQTVQGNGSAVTQEPILDFIDSASVTWTITDDSGSTRTKVQATSSGSGFDPNTILTDNDGNVLVDNNGNVLCSG